MYIGASQLDVHDDGQPISGICAIKTRAHANSSSVSTSARFVIMKCPIRAHSSNCVQIEIHEGYQCKHN